MHLSKHHGDATPGSALRVEVPDIEAFLAEILRRPYPRLNPAIEEKPWGFREISLTDPFGNRLVFCQPLADGQA